MSTFSQSLAQDRRQRPSRRVADRRAPRKAAAWLSAGRKAIRVLPMATVCLLLTIGWFVFQPRPLAGAPAAATVAAPILEPVVTPDAAQFDCRRLVDGIQVMFAPGSAVLTEADKRQLDQVIDRCLKGGHVEVGGHTDSDGTALANQRISVARASAVVDYLIARGIAANSLAAIGYGAMRPVADNSTEAGKAQNRRITFVRR